MQGCCMPELQLLFRLRQGEVAGVEGVGYWGVRSAKMQPILVPGLGGSGPHQATPHRGSVTTGSNKCKGGGGTYIAQHIYRNEQGSPQPTGAK
jgi:hypothetical protein